MPRSDSENRITPSVFDRLIDQEPRLSTEGIASRATTLRQLKESVKRDLENLLNTRQVVDEVPADLKELSHSLAAYGLPDFTNISIHNPQDYYKLQRAIENAIALFEPRLEEVTVAILPPDERERAMHFRVDARLKIEPAPEPVTFDTILEIHKGEYKVKGG